MEIKNSSLIEKDFDNIAIHSENKWDHNVFYHEKLLNFLPNHVESSLEIGCGKGVFTRLLAERSDRVLALDLSREMIRTAEEDSSEYSNISYQVRDINKWGFPKDEFDVIVSIATLHHLPFKETMDNIHQALKPGGILVILDLFQIDTLMDRALELVAVPVNFALSFLKRGFHREPKELKEAWKIHGKRDKYNTLTDIRNFCDGLLPNVLISRHLFWRYSLIWVKPHNKSIHPSAIALGE